MIRATDKMRRLQKVAQGGTLSNESARDSFLDLAVYALIGLVLYEEGSHPDSAPYKRGYVRAATVNNDDDSDTVPF